MVSASSLSLLQVLGLGSVLLSSPVSARPSLKIARQVTAPQVQSKTYDYVIVGGGLSGLVVANRLSEDPAIKVLVIEWGGIDSGPNATIPYNGNNINTASMWPLTSAPDPQLGNASFPVLVGGVLGGGTVVNGEAYNRGAAKDYDAWEQLGNEGWGFSGLLPYFRKSTRFQPPSQTAADQVGLTWNTSAYGQGPVRVSLSDFQYPDIAKFRAAWKETNVPYVKEHALGDAVGAFWMPSSVDTEKGIRSDARVEYYEPVSNRSNLDVLLRTTVTEVLFEDELTANGVKFALRSGNSTGQVYASREVILAAGAIHTPQILQLSGVGPKDVVEAAGIESKLDLPGVGANFQDHPVVFLNFNLSGQAFPNGNSLLTNATWNASQWAQYQRDRTGIYASARGNGVAFLPLSDVSDEHESIVKQVNAQNASQYLPAHYKDESLLRGYLEQRKILVDRYEHNDTAVSEFPYSGGSGFVAVAFEKPLSRGRISINPSQPHAQPIIQYNTITNPVDKEIVLATVRRARKWFSAQSLSSLSPVEVLPGAKYQTDDELLKALVSQKILQPSFAHPSCSCAMMPERLGGCVNSRLEVYGTKKLSVIDASIMPLIPGCHLQASQYAIAEKAADIIKARQDDC